MTSSGPHTIASRLMAFSTARPRLVLRLVLVAVLVAGVGFVRTEVDTDPENMLPTDDPVRTLNAQLAETFGGGPMIVVGIFGEVTSPEALGAIDGIHRELTGRSDVLGEASVSVASGFDTAPSTPAQARDLVAAIAADPVLGDNVLFDRRADGGPHGAALFLALGDKSAATDVADAARAAVERSTLADVDVEVAGQPLAEDAFGQQMFVQMAVFAPLAGLVVFLVLLAFFRRLQLVIPAMLVALATVAITMGALVGSGNTLHIMSSMIPIFLMPIAILDAVHVLSEYFDHQGEAPKVVLAEVVGELGRPIGYTSLTTAVGFAALALVPIPPVRVFGIFVAIGVALAWLFTFTLLPAWLVRRPGAATALEPAEASPRRLLARFGHAVTARPIVILAIAGVAALVAIPGVAALEVNDNPVRWFRGDHEVRQAIDRMNEALPGTFSTNLLVTATSPGGLDDPATQADLRALTTRLAEHDQVGAVQTYLDAPLPMLRVGDQANVRLQLRSGDNVVMQSILDVADAHLDRQPVRGAQLEWAGETYLNLTWQNKMVSGMLVGFATTLGAVFLLLVGLFRSPRWALLAMVPVLWTVLVVYGMFGLAGRDIDMPIAVLSTMVLGIGVDFAIHFVDRFRSLRATHDSTAAATAAFYREPARALTRNAAVVAVGFSPLMLSSLVPYVIVGILLASIIGLSWFATIVLLPAAVHVRPQAQVPEPVDVRQTLDLVRPRVRRAPVTLDRPSDTRAADPARTLTVRETLPAAPGARQTLRADPESPQADEAVPQVIRF